MHAQPTTRPQVQNDAFHAMTADASGVQLDLDRLLPGPARPFIGGLAPWQERRVVRYIAEHVTGRIHVGTLAAIARLSVSHFSRACRESFGASPHALVCRYRVREAMRLMLASSAPLVEIADACGFVDQSHFSRTFHRHTGISPGRWRQLRRIALPCDCLNQETAK